MHKEIELWKNKVLVNYQNQGGVISKDQIDHIVDWMKSPEAERHRKRILRVSVPDAIKLSERWTEKINKNLSDEEDFEGIKKVYTFDDGYCFVELTSAQAYSREGKLMGHCLSRYNPGEQTIFSLRDKNNLPHCTIEVSGDSIKQIQGKENKGVVRKYHKYVQKFVSKFKFKMNFDTYPQIGLIQDEQGNLHDLYNLKKTLVYTERQNIILSHLGLTVIPNIITNGALYLSHNQIKEIFQGFKQNGDLFLHNNQIKEIPKGFKQNGDLFLDNNQIKEIPKGFKQNGDLYLSHNQIKEIPQGFQQNGDLFLNNNQIKEIPKDFKKNGLLNLKYNQISEIPENFKQNGYLDLGYNQIKEISQGFKQNGALYLSHNHIKEIPKGFKQNGYLYLSHNHIKEIPKGFKQNGDLFLNNNQIKEIPKGFKQNGYLDLGYNQIKEISQGFNQNSYIDNQIKNAKTNSKKHNNSYIKKLMLFFFNFKNKTGVHLTKIVFT